MKNHIVYLLLIMASTYSCSTVRKTTNIKKVTADSTTVTFSHQSDVKTKDSTGKDKTAATSKTTSDSGYTKTTTIKEYFSDEFDLYGTATGADVTDEFDFEGPAKSVKPIPINAAQKKKTPKLKYREISIVETGEVKRQMDLKVETVRKSNTHSVDSVTESDGRQTEVKKTEISKDKIVKKFRPSIGMIVGFCLLLLIVAAYYYYRKTNPIARIKKLF